MTSRILHGMISGGISTRDYSAVTGNNIQESQMILDSLVDENIGHVANETYYFERGDKLKVAIMLLDRYGVSLDEVAPQIDWRDFEGLATEILAAKNFAVMQNLRFKSPVIEIDIVAIRMGIAMLIDCKHWKYTAPSAISKVVEKQIERTRRYVAETQGAIAAPVIVTLHDHDTEYVNNVPIVPIAKFSSFVDEFYGNLDKMRMIDDAQPQQPQQHQ